GVQTARRQHADRPRPWHRPASLAPQAQPLPAPGLLGRRRQDGTAGAQGWGIKGQGQWRALPLAYAPGQQWLKARLDDQRAAGRPTCGRALIAKLTHLLAPCRFFTAQPRRPERTDRSQRTGAGQHHAPTPQGPDRRWWLGHMGHVRLDNGGPFGHTGVARQPYPPWGEGSEATSHTMPHSGGACHLLYAVVPSFFKNLLQKAPPGHPCGAPLPHPAAPVQPQPQSRDTVRRLAVGRSGAAVARWGRCASRGNASLLAGDLRRAGGIKGYRAMSRNLYTVA